MHKLLIALSGVALIATASRASAGTMRSPDEVAMLLATMIVADQTCELKTNDFPLDVAVAKLGQDLDDFKPNSRYAPLVEVKIKKAYEFISGMGKPVACDGMRGTLLQFLPDIYRKTPRRR